MIARICHSLVLLLLVLSAHMTPETVQAQSDASAALHNEAAEVIQSDAQEEDESLWDGIVSSILDLFGDDSEEAEADTDKNLEIREQASVETNPNQALGSSPEDGQRRELAARAGDITSNQPHRRHNFRHVQVSAGEVTPSHVYQATVDLISEIDILRETMNVTDSPGVITLQQHQAPIHAYTKCLEVIEKTARVQRRLGMIPVEVNQIPVKVVAQSDVYSSVQVIIEELRRVKRQMVIKSEIQPAPFVGGIAPSIIYKNLMTASLLLDGLVGRPTTPNDVYLHVMRVHDEMELIAAELAIPLEVDPPVVKGRIEQMAVAQQIVRAAYKMIHLQSRLGMEATSAPNYSLEQVTVADVYDAINFLLAETVRIKAHLNLRLPGSGRREARDRTTSDVFAQVLLVIRNLDIMSKAADKTS